MSWLTRHHNMTITYWSKTGVNNSGDPTFAAPVLLKARWEDRQVAFTNFRGEEGTSMAIAWLGQATKIGGFLLNGTSTNTDPFDVTGALEIQGFSKVPALEGNLFEHKAFLTARTVR